MISGISGITDGSGLLSIPAILGQEAAQELPALSAPGQPPLTYRQLYRQAGNTVEELNRLGIGRGDRLAIVLPNGLPLAVAIFAVASGAAAAPLNPSYKTREFAFYLRDMRACALLGDERLPQPARVAAAELGIPVLKWTWDAEAERMGSLSGSGIRRKPSGGWAVEEDIAIVLYTSGTTARPKLVPLFHRRLCITAHNMRRVLRLSPEDRCLNVMPLFHVHGTLNAVLSSLAAGASAVCAPEIDPARFIKWLESSGATWYTAVPAIHQAIVATARRRPGMAVTHRLRLVRSSSAALPVMTLGELESLFGVPVIESYGMTEVDQIACNPLPPAERKPGSVGLPGGPEVAIADERGAHLPQGAVGEVIVRGPNVMPGYENNPQANEASFFGDFFRTGDQGYFDADGYLFLNGRLKEIINRGGEKIAPLEVDGVLVACDGVEEAATFAIPHPVLGEEIGAVIVPRPGAGLSAREIRGFAAMHLSEFKVPRRYFFAQELPRGPTGKLLRAEIASRIGVVNLYRARPNRDNDLTAPTNALERRLQEMWQEVLGIQPIGIGEDFLELGGTSLLTTRLFSRMQAEFGRPVPLGVILECSTIGEMAGKLMREGWPDAGIPEGGQTAV